MKRVVFSIVGTVGGVVALLSYKTHGQLVTPTAALPSAGLPGQSASASAPVTPGPASSAAATSATTPSPSASPSSVSPSKATAASYTGSAVTTRYGVVQVKVTVTNSKISNVAFVQLTADDGRSQEINSQAAPILLQETISAQSAQIDSVSGASYTSAGYVQSLQSALDQAGIK